MNPLKSSCIPSTKIQKLANNLVQAVEHEFLKPQNQPKPNHFFFAPLNPLNRSTPCFTCPFSPFSTKLLERFSVAATARTEMQMEHLELRDDECPAMFPTSTRWFCYPLLMDSIFGCWSNLRCSFLHDFLLLQDPGALNLKVYLFEYFNHTVSSIIAACFMNCGQFISSDTRKWKNKLLTIVPFHYTVASISMTGSVSETLIKQSDHFIPLTQLTKNRLGHCSCVWFFQNTIHPTNGWIRQWKYHSFLNHVFVIIINIQRPGEKAVSPPITNMTGSLKVVSIIYEIKGGFCKS